MTLTARYGQMLYQLNLLQFSLGILFLPIRRARFVYYDFDPYHTYTPYHPIQYYTVDRYLPRLARMRIPTHQHCSPYLASINIFHTALLAPYPADPITPCPPLALTTYPPCECPVIAKGGYSPKVSSAWSSATLRPSR